MDRRPKGEDGAGNLHAVCEAALSVYAEGKNDPAGMVDPGDMVSENAALCHPGRESVLCGDPSAKEEEMNELTLERTPEVIGAEIRMYVDAGRRVTLLCGIEIGRRLVEAKEMLQHGEWIPWLERETDFSTSSAARYMKLFEEYGATQLGLFGPESNFPTLGNLSVSKALRLLAVPEEERESFAEEVHAEEISVKELEEAILERDEARKEVAALSEQFNNLDAENRKAVQEKQEAEKAANKAKTDLKKKEDELRAAQKEIKDLQSKPVEVAIQKDEEAEKRAEALQKEVEGLQKQLKTSDRATAEFKVYFNNCQSDLQNMERLIREKAKADPEGGEKLKKAALAVLEEFRKRFEQ